MFEKLGKTLKKAGEAVSEGFNEVFRSGGDDVWLDTSQSVGTVLLDAFGMGDLATGVNAAVDIGQAAADRAALKKLAPQFYKFAEQLHAAVGSYGWAPIVGADGFASLWVGAWPSSSADGRHVTLAHDYYRCHPEDELLPDAPSGTGAANTSRDVQLALGRGSVAGSVGGASKQLGVPQAAAASAGASSSSAEVVSDAGVSDAGGEVVYA